MEPNTKVLPGVSELIKQSVALYRKNYKILILMGLIPLIFAIIQNIGSSLAEPGQNQTFSITIAIVIGILSLIGVIVQLIYQVTLIRACYELDNGNLITTKAIYKKAIGFILPYIWVVILVTLSTVVPTILLIIPGIIVGILLMLSFYSVMIDGKRGLQALSNSYYYMKGNAGGVFWRFMAFGIIVACISILLALVVFAILFLFSLAFDSFSLLTLIKNPSQGTFSIFSAIISIIYSFLVTCVYMPIATTYGYLIYKNVKLLKPEPNPEIDFKKSKSWFKGLSIAGFVVLILGLASIITFGLISGFESNTKKDKNIQYQQNIPTSQLSFPTQSISLPINLNSLEKTPYTNSDFNFSINLPKGWKTKSIQLGVYSGPTLTEKDNTAISIESITISEEKRVLSEDILMENIATNFKENMSSNMTNMSYLKYKISGLNAYVITGTLNVEGEMINAEYYYIFDDINIYVISAVAEVEVWPTISTVLTDSINTFKTLK